LAQIYCQQSARQPGDIISERRATSSRNQRATSSESAHKLTSRVFRENIASRALLKRLGFEEIGIHRRHAKLDRLWRDCVIVERLLDEDQK
jgi:phosphinothricin acetyltransferase